ncbi:MAG TPA: hypothetical protein VJV78_07660, partial [Polyangiales bacterium]|nr:hypothetical protein [Polyangiales bacterium]
MLWLAGCYDADGHGSIGGTASGAHAAAALAADGGDTPACASQQPPKLEPRSVSLWPPNHKLHEIDVADCVSARDACDNPLRGEFVWASSDEPIDDIGDGHHAPDIGLSADHEAVCVRSERQGPKDGRVYKLGVRVVDGNGNASEASCTIVVDHDQRGVVAADSGEAYRVSFA